MTSADAGTWDDAPAPPAWMRGSRSEIGLGSGQLRSGDGGGALPARHQHSKHGRCRVLRKPLDPLRDVPPLRLTLRSRIGVPFTLCTHNYPRYPRVIYYHWTRAATALRNSAMTSVDAGTLDEAQAPAAQVRRFPIEGGLLLLDKSSNSLFAYNDVAGRV